MERMGRQTKWENRKIINIGIWEKFKNEKNRKMGKIRKRTKQENGKNINNWKNRNIRRIEKWEKYGKMGNWKNIKIEKLEKWKNGKIIRCCLFPRP